MKKALNILIIFVFCAAIVGFTAPEAFAKKDSLSRIQDRGYITIGNSPDYPPFESIDEKGNVIGFDIDLARAVGKKLGVDVKFVTMGFDSIIIAVRNAQVDMGWSGFSISEDRKKSIDFSIPYYSGGQVAITTPNSGITDIKQLKGEPVAAQIGSTGAEAAQKLEGIDFRGVDNAQIAVMMLKNRTVKAVVLDLPIAKEFIKKGGVIQLGDPLEYEENAVVIRKGSPELLGAVNTAIKELEVDGTIASAKKKYGIK